MILSFSSNGMHPNFRKMMFGEQKYYFVSLGGSMLPVRFEGSLEALNGRLV